LAHSNNPYFASLGVKLGFKRVSYYAHMFGLGEKAGLEIAEEQAGVLPKEPPANGGVGMMTSFGEGISLTPLELAGMLTAIANGGTLYYLQYPKSPQDIEAFASRVKRRLEIGNWIPDIKVGMKAVTDYGTGRRAAYDPNEPIMGKTGTCTDYRFGSHLGWFGSFGDVGERKLVVVVLLTGGKSVNGPVAAGVAGGVYRALSGQQYFAHGAPPLPATQSCCAW
jgi:cell division protein FtsI/penicillin-binding protein 2